MSSLQRRVKFQGLSLELEDQKTERRAEKLRRKKARKMTDEILKEEIRLFLLFLQTWPRESLRPAISEDGGNMGLVNAMFPQDLFPNIITQADRLDAFGRVVDEVCLPPSTKAHHVIQTNVLGTMTRSV
jgi:hypothetical protein